MRRIISWLKERLKAFSPRKSRTVKTMFSFSILGALLLLGANAITGTEVSYIRLQADKSVIQAGERFSLDVYAFAHVPVNAVDVTLRFEEDAVEVLSVDKGQSVLTIWTEEPKVEKDRVVLRGGTYRKGFVGEHKIATIDLVARQSGQSEFFAANVMLLAGDGKGTPVSVAESDDSSLNLYVYDENEAPENIGVDVAVSIVTDIDGDGKVSLKDVSSFMGAWSNKSRVYDFNGDGMMSFKDFSIILADAFFGT
ncbi:MAG: hypothetical protein RL538_205 [Candidatus Parcubacteria bacterium]|jgi:hypothetical protein